MPINSETRINTYATGDQTDVTVSRLSDGTFVDVWSSAGQDGSGKGVYMRHYDATGNALGGETLVNTTTTNNQYLPTVTALDGGGFVVGWSSTGQDGSSDGIFLQRFDNSLTAVGSETRANVYTAGSQSASHLASLSDGGYIAVWNSVAQDGDQGGIYARQFNASGAAVTGEFRINATSADNQYQPTVTGLAAGGSVVVWSAHGQDGSDLGVYMQRLDAAGHAVGAETQVNTYTSLNQFDPAVVALNDGSFLVTWDSHAQDSSLYGVYGQHFDASGAAIGAEFRVSGTTAYGQQISSAAAMPDGGFVVTWQSGHQDGSGWGIYAERFDAAGHAVGGEVLVNSTTVGDQVKPHVAAIDNDHYVVTWTGPDGDGTGVFQNVIGTPVSTPGPDETAHGLTDLHGLYDVQVTALTNGGYVIADWNSHSQTGNSITFQVFDAEGHATTAALPADVPGGNTISLAGLSDGKFIISWGQYTPYDATLTNPTYARIFDADGSVVANTFELAPGNQTRPNPYNTSDVESIGNGRFVEVHDHTLNWGANGAGSIDGTIRDDTTGAVISTFSVDNHGGNSYQVVQAAGGFAVTWAAYGGAETFEMFDSNGNVTHAKQALNVPAGLSVAGFNQLASTPDGGFAVAYAASDTGGSTHVIVQTIGSDGTQHASFDAGITMTGFTDLGIAVNGEGHLVVTMQDLNYDVIAKEYDVNGTLLGSSHLEAVTGTPYTYAHSDTLVSGEVVVAWGNNHPAGGGQGAVEWSILG